MRPREVGVIAAVAPASLCFLGLRGHGRRTGRALGDGGTIDHL
jgi:hypothetical protein